MTANPPFKPGTGMMRSAGGNHSPEILLGLSAESESDMKGRESHHDLEGEEHDHDDFTSFVIAPSAAASLEALRARVEKTLAIAGVLRIKGRAPVAGRAVPAVIQAVGARVESWFAPEAGVAGLVVIGLRDMDRAAIEAALGS